MGAYILVNNSPPIRYLTQYVLNSIKHLQQTSLKLD